MRFTNNLKYLLLVAGISFLFPCRALVLRDSIFVKHYKHRQPRQYIIKTNPFPLLWGSLPYTSEFKILGEMTNGLNRSEQIGISYFGKSPFLTLVEQSSRSGTTLSFDASGVRVQASYRFYFKKYIAPKGWYFSPLVSAAVATITEQINNSVYRFTATNINANLLMGHQRIFRNNIVFDWFFGLGRKDESWYASGVGPYNRYLLRNVNYFGKKANVVLGFSVGYSF